MQARRPISRFLRRHAGMTVVDMLPIDGYTNDPRDQPYGIMENTADPFALKCRKP